ncbi:MAG: hypothetical protein BroJett014_24550 [Planctomycetota bacterium]|jgi:hypothetical protein|nr:MAG: hypothetical protein BroJett014_24550 [Planctomycetota bacterium]
MNSNLTVTDPLVEQDVTIIITLAASDTNLAERPLLLSVGVAEQLPVVKTGAFASLVPMIEEAWMALGVRTQVAGATVEEETIAEEQTTAPDTVATNVTTADIDNHETPPPASNPLSAPQPQAQNLSLF